MGEATEQELEAYVKAFGIGLTGGVGTGKSTVARLFAKAGIFVVDADQLARQVVRQGSEGLAAVVQAFGTRILKPDGSLNRSALGEIVFTDQELRKQLESIVHPRIKQALLRLVRPRLSGQDGFFLYEAALIFENHSEQRYAQVWSTFCSPEQQLKRICARPNTNEAKAKAMLAAQMSAQLKAAKAQVVIDTGSSLIHTRAQVTALVASFWPKPAPQGSAISKD